MNALVIIFWMAVNVYMPNLPAYAQSLGANAVTLGLIGGVYGIAMAIGRIPLGLATDNTAKRKRLLIIGSAVLALSCGILVFAQNTDMIILGRLLAGASGAWWVTQNATYANYFSEENQMKAQGMLSASMNWGKLGAALAGGLVAQFLGIHPVFVLALVIAGACIVLSWQIKDTKPAKTEKKTLADFGRAMKNKDLMKLTVLMIIANALGFSAPILFTLVAAKNLGGSNLDMGLLNVAYFLAAALSSLFVGTRAYRKFGGINATVLGFALGGVSCIPAFYHISLPVIYLIQVVSGISFGQVGAALGGMVNRCVQPSERGIAIAIFNCLNAVGVLIGPVMVGTIMEANGFDAAYWTLTAMVWAGAALSIAFIPKKYAAM